MKKFTERSIKALLLTALYVAILAACAGSGDPKTKLSNTDTESNSSASENNVSAQLLIRDISSGDTQTLNANTDTSPLLREEIESADISMDIPTQHVMYFQSDISEIATNDFITIKDHADFLLQNPAVMVSINGHADSQGSERYNMTLSQKRAASVAKLLVQFGVPEEQLILAAHGETVPASDRADWDANRRVELEYAHPITLSVR